MSTESPFGQRSFVLARLLVDPIYREEEAMWNVLRAERDAVSHFFRQIGQEVVINEGEGYAYLRQIEPEGDDPVPRIGRRQPLSYVATLLLVCLREELARFDTAPGDSTKLVQTRQQLRDLVGQFLRESNNQIADTRRIDTAIKRVADLGFLRAFGGPDADSFEVMRIVKARFGPTELEEVRNRLARVVLEDS